MSEEMVSIYKQLNKNEKRNELSQVIIKLDGLINELMKIKNIDISEFKNAKNYNSTSQTLTTEDDILLFFYDDVWNIKEKVLALLAKKD